MSRSNRSLSFVAVIATLGLALPLAGCGRKGALDPPPGGYVLEQGTARTPTTRRSGQPVQKEPEYDDEGRPIVPEGRKRKLPGDWLID